MGTLSSVDFIITKQLGNLSGSPALVGIHKFPTIGCGPQPAAIAGKGMSMWRLDGIPPSGINPPTTGSVCDFSTEGRIYFPSGTSGMDRYITSFGFVTNVAGSIVLYDRLYHKGGYNGTTTGLQDIQGVSVSSPITRFTSGAGNFPAFEILTTIGNTGTTLTLEYINQDGVTMSSTCRFGVTGAGATNFGTAGRFEPIPLKGSDTGVRAITRFSIAASTGTAGSFSFVIFRPIAVLGFSLAGVPEWRDFTTGLPGIPTIHPNACLALYSKSTNTTGMNGWGAMQLISG